MANPLEFILKLTDMFSPALRAAGGVSDSVCNRIASGMNQVNGSSKQMASSVNELRSRLEAVNQVRFGTRISAEFNAATRQAKELERQIDKLENKGTSGGGFGLGGLLAGIGAYGALKGTLGAAAEREQQRISFGVMTGSQKAGDSMLGDIVKMGAATPFENADLIKAAQTMKLFGVENNKILPDLRMLGDVAGGNAEKLQSLSLAYSQVTSAGRLQGQDLLQLVNAGFNPLQEISKATGVSMAELKKKMEHGAISADMVTAAFQRATGPGGQFYMMMEKQSQTLAGRWSTFMDNAKAKLLGLGNILMPVANVALDFASALLNGEGPALAIATAIGGITLAIYGASIATKVWSIWQGVLNTVMNLNPIVLIISLVIALGVWIYSLARKYEGWGKSMQAVWEIVKSFVSLNITMWKSFGETVWYYVQYGWLKFRSFIEWTAGAFGNLSNAFDLLGQGKFTAAKDALFKEIITPSSKAIDELQAKHKASQAEFAKTAAASVTSIIDNYNKIGLTKIAVKKGVSPETANAGGAGLGADAFKGLGDGSTGGKSKADSINSGGQRSIVINIAKQTGIENAYVMSGKEALSEMESYVKEVLRRTLMSVNGSPAT